MKSVSNPVPSSKTSRITRCGVLGGRGLVGQAILKQLHCDERFKIVECVGRTPGIISLRSPLLNRPIESGKMQSNHCCKDFLTQSNDRLELSCESFLSDLDVNVKRIEDLSPPNEIDVLFSALPSDTAYEIEGALRAKGYRVISNASAYRMDKEVPMMLPGSSFDGVEKLIEQQEHYHGGWIACHSNCSVAIAVRVLMPLIAMGLEHVNIVTMQSVSGAGYKGVDAAEISANVLLDIEGEAEKIEQELTHFFSSINSGEMKVGPSVNARAHRVPTEQGHVLSFFCRFGSSVCKESIRAAWANSRLAHSVNRASISPGIDFDQDVLVQEGASLGWLLDYREHSTWVRPKDFMRRLNKHSVEGYINNLHESDLRGGTCVQRSLKQLPEPIAIATLREHAPGEFSFIATGDNLGVGAARGTVDIARWLLDLFPGVIAPEV